MIDLSQIKAIVTDIEGTTSSISFVHEVLFPYAREHLVSFVTNNHQREDVRQCLDAAKKAVEEEEGHQLNDEELTQKFLDWIQADRKQTQLKQLQGMIWVKGYQDGDFKGHVYDDVPESLKVWRTKGLLLAVFSSGSVPAQKLLFGYSEAGDLTSHFASYFDTKTGPKKEKESYLEIASQLELNPGSVLFLSDVEAELDAAASAGMLTTQVLRPGISPTSKHQTVSDFHEITSLLENS